MRARLERKRYLASVLSLTLVGSASLFAAAEASAYDVYACGTISGGNAVLKGTPPAHTGAGPCFLVTGGYDLDLNGYKVTCSGSCGPAVECSTSGGSNVNSIVQGKTNDTVNDIEGDFSVGVKNCGIAKNLQMTGLDVGILYDDMNTDGKDFFSNVITLNPGGTGISVKVKDNSDGINDNRITGGSIGIQLLAGKSSPDGAWVRHNILRKQTTAGISCSLTTNDYFRFDQNSITEGGVGSIPFSLATSHASYDANICENAGGVSPNRCACEMDKFSVTTVGNCPL